MSVHNLLRSRSLPMDTQLRPEQVLTTLNGLFPMEDQGGNYFTIWYGVYQKSSRTLRYASGGHPPALAFTVTSAGAWECTRLATQGQPIGMFTDCDFDVDGYRVPPGCRMVLLSDGAFEFALDDGRQFSLGEFISVATQFAASPAFAIDTVIQQLRDRAASGILDDDCSLIAADFA